MSTVQSIFPLVSVRNPWGYLIQNGYKKIENRKKKLSKEYHNIWIALHVSKTFQSQEEKYAQKYLKNHSELLTKSTKNTTHKIQSSLNGFFTNSSFKSNDRQKISRLISSSLKPQLGHIIAFIKISECVNSEIGKTFDSLYCDEPYKANSHWVISDLISLNPHEYISTRGYPGCSKIKDTLLNNLLSNTLNQKLMTKNKIIENENKEIEIENDTETQTQTIEENDDDILDIMNGLDNGTQTQTATQDTMDEFTTFLSPKSKKRKRKEIVASDDDSIECNYSPPIKKTKIITPKLNKLKITSVNNNNESKRNLPSFVTHKNSNNNNNDRFAKFSKTNSFYNMKYSENKIDLMIKPEINMNRNINGNNDSDIDAELDAMLEKSRKERNNNNCNNNNKLTNRILLNPNELRRKEHLSLPDQYKYRIIVFDTETAGFKPEGVIIDIGAVEIINGKLTGRKFQSYIKPWAKIHNEAMKVHGITERFLENNADGNIYQIIQSFMEWINSNCICSQCKNLGNNEINRKHKLKLIGHNVPFDIRHLNAAINYCQNKMEKKIWKNIHVENTFDTQIYYRNVLGNHSSYSLDAMCQKFGVRNDERKHSHGALVDAMCTAKCLQEMWKRDKDVKDRKCKNRFFTKKL